MANSTTVSGSEITTSAASDTSYCRVSGYLKSIIGNALRGINFIVRHIDIPVATGTDTLFLGDRIPIISDSTGKVSFDVIQESTIKIELIGRVIDLIRICKIPAATSANLVDIVFPRVSSVAFAAEDASIALEIGATHSYVITGTLSNGEELGITSVTLESSNTDRATVSGTTVTGVAAGTVTITISSVDTSGLSITQEPDGDTIYRVNETDPTLPSGVTVTVS